MLPRSQAISGSEASTLCASTVWARKYGAVGAKRITVEQLRKVLGLESVKDLCGNVKL
jgi:hypothetical protein